MYARVIIIYAFRVFEAIDFAKSNKIINNRDYFYARVNAIP